MSPIPELPYIDTIEQAEAMGKALHRVHRHSASGWAPKLFSGSVAPYLNGRKALNEELNSMWSFMTTSERVALVTAYVEERMKR